jgi:ornithine cyclodeaminase/alanine dehydrogenase-like protein (mu-crystallin family)
MENTSYGSGKTMVPADSSDHDFHHIKLISAGDIKEIVSMKEAVSLMAKAFYCYSSGKCHMPQRYISEIPGLSMDVFFKPVYSDDLGRIAAKILTQKQGSSLSGKPAIVGIVLLLDASSGEILSLMDGTYITALRTGAASGIATQLLARSEAATAAIFGCGAQGYTQLEAVCSVRPIQRAFLYDMDPSASRKMKDEMQVKLGISIEIEGDLSKLKEADIICTATNARNPLFRKADVSAGVHINAIGSFKPQMQEIDPGVIRSSRLYVDSIKAVLHESGDLIKPINEGVFSREFVSTEIGQLVNGSVGGRRHEDDITLFKSVGIAVQDLYVADAVYKGFMDH